MHKAADCSQPVASAPGVQGPSGEVGRHDDAVPGPASAHAAEPAPELAAELAHPAPEQRLVRLDAASHGLRVDKALVAIAPEFSRSHLQRLLEDGHVRLDGQRVDAASRKVRAGQQLEVDLVPTDESRAYRPQPMALDIVHEDEHLLVIDKPAGLVVHPAPGHWQGTLLNGLLAHHEAAVTLPRAGIVHRLDKDTSGLMLVGKTLPAVTALVRAIAAREVHRRYLAIACGRPPAALFDVDAPVGRDPRSRVRMAVVGESAGGRPARTSFELLAAHDGFAGLRCTLHSGRTHQIRVHLASRGLPLVADALYGGRPALGLVRQALHAVSLALAHPVSGRPLVFERPPPPDLAAAWERLRAL
jgi:23S rRNA pseudouridine1911/1915/1917 synthase